MLQAIRVIRPGTLAEWIVAIAAVHIGLGLGVWVYWQMGGGFGAVRWYFDGPGAIALLGFAVMETALAGLVWSNFNWSQPMWASWGCLTLAGAVRTTGVVVAHILTAPAWLNPLPDWVGREPLRGIGLMLTGPGHVLFVVLAMAIALQVYWSEGWKAGLRRVDWIALGAVGLYVLRQMYELVFVYREEFVREPYKLWNWVTDPLILVALGLALLLYRTSGGYGSGGLVGRCWAMYALGLFLSAMGDMALWLEWSGRLTWSQISLLTWYIWYPAAAAYAAGPALQWEAARSARRAWVTAVSGTR